LTDGANRLACHDNFARLPHPSLPEGPTRQRSITFNQRLRPGPTTYATASYPC